ncbi:MAG: ABC transporter ATP-binding protein [Candidatus Hydrogenedentes bacterium]|nr:ABC transporter ATP-binding protein [Candidatus Hydrogenedentota bacterium]
METLLDIRNLEVRFRLREGIVRAVHGINLRIAPNRTIGVVGESGCGKSITAKAMLQILPSRGKITAGEMLLAPRDGGPATDLAKLHPKGPEIRRIRGGDISMIFQEPMVSLSPVHTIGNQITESVLLHRPASKPEALDRAIEMLRLVGVPMPEKRVNAYPHELSGGLRQRCMIAMALVCRPRLLIADEPTTALDVTIQSQILSLIRRLQRELGMAVMMITHDLGVIAETSDDVAVMYLGRIVEQAPVKELFRNPKHPYTQGLLDCIPRFGKGRDQKLTSIPGSVPDPFTTVPGCPFHPRCAKRIAGVCDRGVPPLLSKVGPEHRVACVLYDAPRPEAAS